MGKCDETSVEVNMGDSASPMKPDNFTFTVPPEAPVFEPTAEEFQDPLAYINKIRPIAEKSGICKIKPPEHWQPPFAVDVDRLRFTPRIQRLNELEAITRVKLNFLDQILKFWELQGSSLKIPTVEKKSLDLYALNKIVTEAGGFETCTTERKWSKIARRMGYPQGKGVGSILKNHYERILYPYEVFKSSGVTEQNSTKIEIKTEQTPEKVNPNTRSRSSTKPAATPPPTRRQKISEPGAAEGSLTEGALPEQKTPVKEEKEPSPETRRSPRENKWMSSVSSGGVRSGPGGPPRSTRLREHRLSNMTVSVTPAPPPAPLLQPNDPLAKYMCHTCGRGDIEEQMLLCDGCDDSYHTFCLVPPLPEIPKGDWRCPVCLAEEVSKPAEAFGFEQASREYTLQQFGEMADQFKSDYFNMPVHMVPTSTVEKEFWRIMSSIDEDVTVEYGADLHSMDHGSGFPTKCSAHLYPGEQQYADSPWNLNNLPVLDGSVLTNIDADISGMKVPWLYVGMCFATFCWHNEDHWSYSINYLHWGEPKTWYGVPGCKAEALELAMQAEAPSLFQSQPDLLHQLVTIMNPNTLMKAGVPVYRTDQHAGEFVITFPRAYHAGFNQGYNFAEAVNFTPADWLRMGRECISHYSTLRRYCVFSHDELVCKMALKAANLPLPVALAAFRDTRVMLMNERKLRKALLDWGVSAAEREAFELLPDDLRQCHACNTTLFLSGVACACAAAAACLRHYASLCRCAPDKHVLKYRYTLDELVGLVEALKGRSDGVRAWAEAVRSALQSAGQAKRTDLDGLRAHRAKAQQLMIHNTELVRALDTAITEAEKCLSVIQQLDLNKMRTRTRALDPKYRLTVQELTLFSNEIDALPCVLPEGSAVKEVLRQTEEFEKRAMELLAEDLGETDTDMLRELEETVDMGSQLCIVLEQLPPLQARLQQVRYLEKVRRQLDDSSTTTVEVLKQLIEEGDAVPPNTQVQAQIAVLHTLIAEIEEWEQRASSMLSGGAGGGGGGAGGGAGGSLGACAALVCAGKALGASPPSLAPLAAALHHAADWTHKVEEMQSKDLYPYYHSVEALYRKGCSIPLALVEKQQLKAALDAADEWLQGAKEMFLLKKQSYSLLEALWPRASGGGGGGGGGSGGGGGGGAREGRCARAGRARRASPPRDSAPPHECAQRYKDAEAAEIQLYTELRARNMRKDVLSSETSQVFCVCQKRQHGVMTQCELCKDWFHAGCITSFRGGGSGGGGSGDSSGDSSCESEAEGGGRRLLCAHCVRTRRPKLDKILALLVWLQRLPVRLAEGEALQCVTERAMAWQDRAASALMLHAQAIRDKSEKMNGNSKKSDARTSSAASEHAYSASPKPACNNGSLLARLEDLMLEGDLLEVRLNEQRLVWAAICRVRGCGSVLAAPRRRPLPPARKRRHRDSAAGSSSGRGSSSTKRGASNTANYLNRKQGVSPGAVRRPTSGRGSRRPRGRRAGPHPHLSSSAMAASAPAHSDSSSSGDGFEDCAAPNCLSPRDKEVFWVQCDGGCEGWYHMVCVGISRHSLAPDDDYVCGACSVKRDHCRPEPDATRLDQPLAM